MAQWVKVMPPSLMTWLWSLRTPEGLHQKSGFNDPGRAKDVQRDTVPLPLADRLLKQWSPRNWNFLGNLILRERKVWRLVPARAGTCLLERLHSADHSPEDLEGKRWVGQGWQGQGCSWTASIWRLPVSYFNLNLKSRHRAKSLGGGGVSTGLFICSCPHGNTERTTPSSALHCYSSLIGILRGNEWWSPINQVQGLELWP